MKTRSTLLVLCALAAAPIAARSDVFTNVPAFEIGGYQLVYTLDIPVASPGWNTVGMLTGANGYSVNNAAAIPDGSFTRVGYYMELSGATNPNFRNGWIFVSFDSATLTSEADMLGVPSTTSGEFYQENLLNMNVFSNVTGIITGTGIATGNIEFFPSNYTQANTRSAVNGGAVPNASGTTYDFGDGNANTVSGHGSMQIHNYDLDGAGPGIAGQTLFAYNAWGTARVSELGIGTNPNASQAPDYTVTANADDAGSWTTRTLQVVVLPVPEPGSVGMLAVGVGLLLRRRVRRN